ncbi:MAG TPA: cytochrome b/b6 domain-containing protein [Coriobacteriia bacterium]|nr:cytochrome b/b6 domain-containing protein [Coriobacteriia bacterium]
MAAINLVDINIWLDVIFVVLYVVVVLGLTGHFIGNLLTGRVKKRFIGKQWPHHEGPPIPFLPKFLHFTHVFSMFALGISGMYIRFPFFDGGRTPMRWVHYVFMVIVTVNLLVRLWYAFFARQRDWREFAISREDIVTAPKVVLYYIFVRSSKPHLGKYNVMQKGTYVLFVPLLVVQAFTGFALVTDPFIFGYSPRDLLLGWWLGVMVGSTDLAGWYARTLHYLITWLFIILTTVHAYLSMTEDFPAFRDFFGLGGHSEHAPDAVHGAHASASTDGGHARA